MHVVYDRFVKHVVVANEKNQPSSTIIVSISIDGLCYFCLPLQYPYPRVPYAHNGDPRQRQ